MYDELDVDDTPREVEELDVDADLDADGNSTDDFVDGDDDGKSDGGSTTISGPAEHMRSNWGNFWLDRWQVNKAPSSA